jgi:hypothetical protein
VFAVVPDCHVDGWRYADVWRTHFYGGLQRSGADLTVPQDIRFDWARPPQLARPEATDGPRRAASEELLRQIRRAADRGLDAVVSYCFSNDLELDVVDRVREAGIPWINFFCDSSYAFHTVEALARRTSLNWFVESAAESGYRELGVPYLRAPYAVDPDALPDASCSRPERALAFVGTAHRERLKLAVLFRLFGADLHVRGWGWPNILEPSRDGALGRAGRAVARRLLRDRAGGHLADAEYVAYLRTSQALLGMNEGYLPGGASVAYLKLRDLELPGMGCAYLAQHHDDLALVYDVGQEIRSFRTITEGLRAARELARDPHQCRRMGLRARERVLAEHTWSTRLPQLLGAI